MRSFGFLTMDVGGGAVPRFRLSLPELNAVCRCTSQMGGESGTQVRNQMCSSIAMCLLALNHSLLGNAPQSFQSFLAFLGLVEPACTEDVRDLRSTV